MMTMKLTVVSDASDIHLSQIPFPDGIDGKIVPRGSELPLPGETVLLITEDSGAITEQWEQKRLYAIYVGDASDLEDKQKYVYDVWPRGEDEAMYTRRLNSVLDNLKAHYDVEFYKSALMTTIDTVPDMLWFKRLDGIHTLVNHAFTEVVHKTREDIIGKDHFYIWDAPRPAEGNEFACAESEEIAISTGKMYVCDEPVKTREGMKQLTTYKTPLYGPYGELFGTVGVGHDVTNFSNLGIELSILIENMPFPMTIFTPDWQVVRMNERFMEVVGISTEAEFDYRNWKKTIPVPLGNREEDSVRHLASREYQVEVNGKPKSLMITEMEIRDFFGNISGYFCTMMDVTYQRTYEASIIKAANTDVLTGMYNRRYVYDYLGKHTGSKFHFIYMDMDHFKEINDHYGHNVGDEVLIRTGRIIQQHFPNAVTGRLGGDEFAVVDTEHTQGKIKGICEKLEKAVEDTFSAYGCGTGISIGIAFCDGSIGDFETLLRKSDAEMYAMKNWHHSRKGNRALSSEGGIKP